MLAKFHPDVRSGRMSVTHFFRRLAMPVRPSAMERRPSAGAVTALLLLLCAQTFLVPQAQATGAEPAATAAAKTAAAKALAGSSAYIPPRAIAGSLTSFDVPGAVNGTFPSAMSATGLITGYYNDANLVPHGFLRKVDGSFITFDVSGAAAFGTAAADVNLFGEITGKYYDANGTAHGFVRAVGGTFNTFDAPGVQPDYVGTLPQSIGLTGAVAGNFYGADSNTHGFVRSRDGRLTSFDAPGAISTSVADINWDETIVGSFVDPSSHSHGFLRSGDGSFATVGPPETQAFADLSPGAGIYINPQRVIAGTYFQPISDNVFGGNYRAFVQVPSGAITTFDAASYPPCCIWSFPTAINVSGVIVGSFNDGRNINHGFVRTPDERLTTFDVPGAGTGFNQGTVPLGISALNTIMGLYIDSHSIRHGFLLMPVWP